MMNYGERCAFGYFLCIPAGENHSAGDAVQMHQGEVALRPVAGDQQLRAQRAWQVTGAGRRAIAGVRLKKPESLQGARYRIRIDAVIRGEEERRAGAVSRV